jgi:hypothetical protein
MLHRISQKGIGKVVFVPLILRAGYVEPRSVAQVKLYSYIHCNTYTVTPLSPPPF